MSDRRMGRLALGIALFWMLARPLLYGSPVGEPLQYGAFLLAYAIAPGWLLYRHLRAPVEDELHAFGMAWTLGWVLQTLVFLLLRVAGAAEWFVFYPLVLVPLAILSRARARDPSSPISASPLRSAGGWHAALLMAILLVAVERTPLYHAAGWWREHSHDLLFHAGNVAELRDHWPLRDPRAATLPLNYHVFAYALPAGASAVTGLAVGDLLFRLGAATLPLLLVFQVYNAGRAFGGRPVAGLAAAAIVALHVDLGAGMQVLWPDRAHAFRFGSTLDIGIWRSLTTSGGLVLFTGLAIALRRWLASGRTVPAREAVLVALLGFAASGAKGSVMPVVAASLAALVLWELARGGTLRRDALAAFLVALIVSLPLSLHLALGEGAWASSIFALAPGATMEASGFFQAAARVFGADPGSHAAGPAVVLVAPFVLGHLGFAGAVLLARRASSASPLDAAGRWLVLALAVGLALALGLDSTGRSQLFFLHNGQVGLAVLAGASLAAAAATPAPARVRRRFSAAAGLVLLAFAAPTLAGALDDLRRQILRDAESAPTEPALARAHAEGLTWIRERSPADAVFLVRHPSILISTFGERRTFLETVRFTPERFAQRGLPGEASAVPHPELAELRERLFAIGGPDDLARLRAALPAGSPLYFVQDEVRTIGAGNAGSRYEFGSVSGGPSALGAGLTPEFENEAIRIVLLPDGPR